MLDTSIIQSALAYAQRVYGKDIQDKQAAEQYINTIWEQFQDKETAWLSDAAQKYEVVAHQQADQAQSANAIQYALTAATIHELINSKGSSVSTEAATTTTVQPETDTAEQSTTVAAVVETVTPHASDKLSREAIYDQLHIPPQTPLVQAQHLAHEQGHPEMVARLQEIEAELTPHEGDTLPAVPTATPAIATPEMPSPTLTVTAAPELATPQKTMAEPVAVPQPEVVEPAMAATEATVVETPELLTTTGTPAMQQAHHESLHKDLVSLKEQIAAIEKLADTTEDALEGVETGAIELVSEMKKDGSDEQVDSAQSVRTEVAEAEVELAKLQRRMSHIQSLIKHLESIEE